MKSLRVQFAEACISTDVTIMEVKCCIDYSNCAYLKRNNSMLHLSYGRAFKVLGNRLLRRPSHNWNHLIRKVNTTIKLSSRLP
ncbi:uncharacterized protein PHALS_14529 [Plasmopara halstedii]|uniref:Uncharacterized protein n=1 Tax=Plasmopara halstedii TaxID=4781 RepID=A0A0P1AJZ5_PLAHL|nr:uncharacterized protein PHALS_14529 [Plasmopara halstedii]CEG41408.1 hypothetical protein PHALS_14529 [Plasmopara halstedii]|eukprot:XP_024577777.1 hypothetical protein PHALS_14529 [Plasmopara halstedii]